MREPGSPAEPSEPTPLHRSHLAKTGPATWLGGMDQRWAGKRITMRENEAEVLHLGDQIVADVAAVFGTGSPEASQMRVIIDTMLDAWLRRDRAALESAIADGHRLFESLNIDIGLVELLSRRFGD
jgi:hypothetical protein